MIFLRLCFLALFIGLSSPSFSKDYESYTITNSLDEKSKNIDFLIKKAIKNTSQYWGNRVKFIKFNIKSQNYNVREMGLSNADRNYCSIDLMINNDDFKDEEYIYFSIIHEIAHCYVGKEVFLSPEFKWKVKSNLDPVYQKYIDEKTIQLMSNRLDTNSVHPFIVYHEIAADILALSWIGDKELYLKIYEIRLEDWENNLKRTKHASHWSIQKIIDTNYIIKDVELVIQDGFKSYMDEMIKIN